MRARNGRFRKKGFAGLSLIKRAGIVAGAFTAIGGAVLWGYAQIETSVHKNDKISSIPAMQRDIDTLKNMFIQDTVRRYWRQRKLDARLERFDSLLKIRVHYKP